MAFSFDSPDARHHALTIIRPALLLAPTNYLDDVRERLAGQGVQAAIATYNIAPIFAFIIGLLDRQGVSNRAALTFAVQHGSARWDEIIGAIDGYPFCPKLTSYWHFEGCFYRKDAKTCSRLDLLPWCPLPIIPARKGALAQAGFGLAFFIRDVCDGDLVRWIDDRLSAADPGKGAADRAARMRAALLQPLINIPGTGPKVWSMILAEMLLGGNPERERWVTTGASMIAIDSLIHSFLHRTGILRRLDAEHTYGAACYQDGGCADVIAGLAEHIDARKFNPAFPACFPRFVQFAIWRFCAEGGLDICNANRVDDFEGCNQRYCPAYEPCERIAIKRN